jgi:hypothetical protein
MPDWIFQLLKKYPTAMDLAKAAVNKLALIPYISKERKTGTGKKIVFTIKNISARAIFGEVVLKELSSTKENLNL